ncbi:hypothetical protein KI387_044099 [Taxus chinensis]|uniref:Uncharacterized protein n=1 Tax=Taxus chinensis TaxID=29808 RepID=A0AA38FFY0_TAXCH|nr:hypothetical protein KI387_044099 [Taxus chinensis]
MLPPVAPFTDSVREARGGLEGRAGYGYSFTPFFLLFGIPHAKPRRVVRGPEGYAGGALGNLLGLQMARGQLPCDNDLIYIEFLMMSVQDGGQRSKTDDAILSV